MVGGSGEDGGVVVMVGGIRVDSGGGFLGWFVGLVGRGGGGLWGGGIAVVWGGLQDRRGREKTLTTTSRSGAPTVAANS